MNGEWVIFILVVGVEVCVCGTAKSNWPIVCPPVSTMNDDDVTLSGTHRSTGSGNYASATLFTTNSIRTAPQNTPDLPSDRNSDKPPALQYGDSKEFRIWNETVIRGTQMLEFVLRPKALEVMLTLT